VLESIRKAIDFLRSNFDISNSRVLPYNSIIIPLSYYFYHNNKSNSGSGAEDELSKWFWLVSLSTRYDSAAETKIAEDIKEVDKILRGEKAEFRYDMIPITTEKIINQKLNLGSAFCKAILCLYITGGSREFINNSKVNLNSFSKFNSAELHHIFPQNYLKKHQPDHYHQKDSIVNIALASAALNKKYRDRAPSDYIADCADNNSDMNITMNSHYIKDFRKSGLLNDDFKTFLNDRASNLLNEIKKHIGELSPIEVEFSTDEKLVIEKYEKAIRDFIEDTLNEKDADYWNNLDPGFRRKIEERLQDWIKKNPYQSNEEQRLIDYCQIMEYFNIIKANWIHFAPIMKSKSELKKHFENINNFRNSFMHSRKIDLTTKKLAEASFIWFGNILHHD
jgi:hypothetical protein